MLGESVGNFDVIKQLGRGGMGEVWLAEHNKLKTRVAIKILLAKCSGDTLQVQRFFNEAIAVSKIKHAGIVRIFDSGFLPSGEAYLVMEYLEGESLAARITRCGRLRLDEVAEIGRQIASILEATHAADIIHRDLKPDNIFIVPDAELPRGERVKILDFGIAKLGVSSALTGTSGTMGTPFYMSPEQWRNSGRVDARADTYALGCLTFEMATGRIPFVASSIGEACAAHLHDPPPPARSLVPTLPPELDVLLGRLLAKSPDDRPSMRELKAELTKLRDTVPETHADALAATLPPVTSTEAVSTPAAGTAATLPPESSTATMPPASSSGAMKPITTLSGATASTISPPSTISSRWRGYAIGAAGVSVLAIVGVATLTLRKRNDDPRPAAASTSTPVAAAADAAVPDAPLPLDAAVTPTITLHFDGTPGAEVVDAHDQIIATVPGDVPVPRGSTPIVLRVRRAGFEPKTISVTPSENQTRSITLSPIKPARTTAPTPRPRPPAPSDGKGPMPDELPKF